MSIVAAAYEAGLAGAWDALCAASINGTFLHQRGFLSYHADRFPDASAVLMHDGRLVGLLPASPDPADPRCIVSHPGATYGGLVHAGWLSGSRMLEAFDALKAHYAGRGFTRFRYKAIPSIYASSPAQDDLYALFRQGAVRSRCDLSSTVDLQARPEPDKRRRWELRQAEAVAVVDTSLARLDAYWPVLEQVLASRHQQKPVHSLVEMRLLQGLFPEQIRLRCAVIDGQVAAGSVVFTSPRTWHLQYMASTELGREHFALDLVVERLLDEAAAAGVRYVDFGNSNEQGGKVLNEGLHRYKAKFGAGGTAYEFYELELG